LVLDLFRIFLTQIFLMKLCKLKTKMPWNFLKSCLLKRGFSQDCLVVLPSMQLSKSPNESALARKYYVSPRILEKDTQVWSYKEKRQELPVFFNNKLQKQLSI